MVVAALLERYARDEVRLRRNRTSTHELVDFVAARLDAARQGDFGLCFSLQNVTEFFTNIMIFLNVLRRARSAPRPRRGLDCVPSPDGA